MLSPIAVKDLNTSSVGELQKPPHYYKTNTQAKLAPLEKLKAMASQPPILLREQQTPRKRHNHWQEAIYEQKTTMTTASQQANDNYR